MKKVIFLLMGTLSLSLWSQDRELLRGQLLYKNTYVVAANVINNSAQLNTITDDMGSFEIPVKEGDELIFSSIEIRIRSVVVTQEMIDNKRIVVSVDKNINALNEVVVTPDNVQKFVDLKEEEFKQYDYVADKSSKIVNVAADDRQLSNGLNLVNIAKLIATLVKGDTENESSLKPSEILPQVFEESFFTNDLQLDPSEISAFLELIDQELPSKKLLQKSRSFELIDFLISTSQRFREQS
ncbi:MAG: hypothetical protein ACON42_01225 [Flavobacteriaceae bacterium]